MSRVQQYYQRMLPHAQQAGRLLGLPAQAILVQWALETGHGSSQLAQRHNNHGGIRYTAHADYQVQNPAGPKAGYTTLESFARDYVRVMRLGFYDEVRRVGRTGDVNAVLDALCRSPYATDPQYGSKLRRLYANERSFLDRLVGRPDEGVPAAPVPAPVSPDAAVVNGLRALQRDGLPEGLPELSPALATWGPWLLVAGMIWAIGKVVKIDVEG